MKFPGGGNMNALLGQAQKMQAEMKQMQEKLNKREIDVESHGGRIKMKMNGKQELTHIEISAEIIDPEAPELLADMVKVAVNEAVEASQKMVADEMSKIVPPGMAGLF